MKKIAFPFSILLTLTVFVNTTAQIRLPSIIGNHMVLQQNSTVKLWGWCNPAEKIKINGSWDTTTYTAEGTSGAKWVAEIKTPAAGGPYTIKLVGSNTIMLDDILIGEVWACSGQSNMEMTFNWPLKEYETDVQQANNKSIRFFYIPKTTASFPQDNTEGHWVVCSPDEARRFSVAGYYFGKNLQEKLHFPIGLINSSWGGTPAEAWTPAETIGSQAALKDAAAKLKTAPWWPIETAATYNAMISPITNYSIAGVIWYQGEANVGTASTYAPLLSTMITAWRKAWKKDFPFYYVQIAPFSGYGAGIASAILREQQTKAQSLSNTGMVVIHDLVSDVKDIHPHNKKDVGLRLANYALAETYHVQGLNYKSPMYKSMSVEKGKASIMFSNADNGLMVKGDTLTGFYIAGEDKIFVPATAKIITGKGKDATTSVLVWNKNVVNPVAVRFGFTNTDMPNLFSKEGLPVNLFRTDDWDEVNTVLEKK